MISKRCTAFRLRRWGVGVSLAGGGVVSAAMIGVAAAHADTPTPADLLGDAQTELTYANQVLNGIDVPVEPPGTVVGQLAQQEFALDNLSHLQSAEAVISSHDGALSGLVNQLFFTPLDQGWYNTSEAVLNADQALAAAVASGSGLEAAQFALLTPDLQLLDYAFDSANVEEIANFF